MMSKYVIVYYLEQLFFQAILTITYEKLKINITIDKIVDVLRP